MMIADAHLHTQATTVQIEEEDFAQSRATSEFIGQLGILGASRMPSARVLYANTMPAAVIDSAHPWYAEGVQLIESFANISDDWNESGAQPPNGIAIMLAKAVLRELSSTNFAPARIDLSSAGGICISFDKADRYGDVECLNSGNLIAATMNGDENPIVWDIETNDISNTVAAINGFIRG